MTAIPLPVATWASIADDLAIGLADVTMRLDAGDWAGLARVEWSPPELPPSESPTADEMHRLRNIMEELTRIRARVEQELATVQHLRADITRRRAAGRAYVHAPAAQ